jgi:hypothetical protein
LLHHQRHTENGGRSQQQAHNDAGCGGNDEPIHAANVADNVLRARHGTCLLAYPYPPQAGGPPALRGECPQHVWVGYDDVVDLVCGHAGDIMARGERTWLDDHGIERGFRAD